jgi:hypothetical protein
MVKSWIGQDSQNGACLVAFKMPIDKFKVDSIIDINVLPYGDKTFKGDSNSLNNSSHYDDQDKNNDKGTHKWAVQAIKNGQIILNDNDLLDFLMIAKHRTSGYFRIHANANNLEDRSYRNSEVYCMFIDKGPLANKKK